MTALRDLLLRQKVMLGALLTLSVKVSGSLIMLGIFALAARTMAAESFGLLAILFNGVSLIAVVATFGQDTHMMRAWGEYVEREPGAARGAILFGCRILVLGLPIAAAVVVAWLALVDGRASAGLIAAAAAFLVSQASLHFSSSVGRVVRGVLWSEPAREIAWRLPLLGLLALLWWSHDTVSATVFFAVAAAGQAAAVLVLGLAVASGLPAPVRRAPAITHGREWLTRTGGMIASASAEAVNQYVDVVAIGALAGPMVAASYFAVSRYGNVFSMLAGGLQTYSIARISQLHFAGRQDELQLVIARVMVIVALLVAVLLAVIVVAGPLLLSLFGSYYSDLYPALLIYAGAMSFAALAGPGSTMLLVTGHEGLYSRLLISTIACKLVLFCLLVPLYGTNGAACALALTLVPMSVAIVVICIRRLGVDPSICALPRLWRALIRL